MDRACRDACRPCTRHCRCGSPTIRRRAMAVRRAGRAWRKCRLGAWHRRHCADADHAQRLPDADLHWRFVARDRSPRARIYGRLPADGGADDRRLRGAGPAALLHLLRRRPHPDVSDHRHLGRRRADQGELQILPLHACRLGADAGRHAGDDPDRRHDLDPGADGL
jgi:hypothetical protein